MMLAWFDLLLQLNGIVLQFLPPHGGGVFGSICTCLWLTIFILTKRMPAATCGALHVSVLVKNVSLPHETHLAWTYLDLYPDEVCSL
jgi:hypothetical protein